MTRTYSHNFRVFEVEPVSRVQVEVLLISNPDSPEDRERDDRLTSGVCVGSLRLLVDRNQMDAFAIGANFSIILQPSLPCGEGAQSKLTHSIGHIGDRRPCPAK
jgi:hypothetical protein